MLNNVNVGKMEILANPINAHRRGVQAADVAEQWHDNLFFHSFNYLDWHK